MPIICMEGPNAVGKTTVASALATTDDAFVVPEVNVLFERPPDEPPGWYFERQVDRQRRYFEAMQVFSPDRVSFHDVVTIDDSARAIRSAARSARSSGSRSPSHRVAPHARALIPIVLPPDVIRLVPGR